MWCLTEGKADNAKKTSLRNNAAVIKADLEGVGFDTKIDFSQTEHTNNISNKFSMEDL